MESVFRVVHTPHEQAPTREPAQKEEYDDDDEHFHHPFLGVAGRRASRHGWAFFTLFLLGFYGAAAACRYHCCRFLGVAEFSDVLCQWGAVFSSFCKFESTKWFSQNFRV